MCRCVAACCSVLQCVAVCCSVLQEATVREENLMEQFQDVYVAFINVHARIQTRVRARDITRTRVQTHQKYLNTHTRTRVRASTRMCAHTHAHTHVHTYTYAHACIYNTFMPLPPFPSRSPVHTVSLFHITAFVHASESSIESQHVAGIRSGYA